MCLLTLCNSIYYAVVLFFYSGFFISRSSKLALCNSKPILHNSTLYPELQETMSELWNTLWNSVFLCNLSIFCTIPLLYFTISHSIAQNSEFIWHSFGLMLLNSYFTLCNSKYIYTITLLYFIFMTLFLAILSLRCAFLNIYCTNPLYTQNCKKWCQNCEIHYGIQYFCAI